MRVEGIGLRIIGPIILAVLLQALALQAHAEKGDAFLSPRKVLAVADKMSLVDRKQLTYLCARLGNRTLAEPLAKNVLAEEPGDLRILLAMASMYLSLQDASMTLAYAQRLLDMYPQNKDGLFFLAAGNQLANNPEKARDILLRMRGLYPAGVRFPFELDLASVSLLCGDWPQAITSYQRVLRESQIAPPLRQSVRRVLDALYRKHLPLVRVGFTDIDAGTGKVREYGGFTSLPINARIRVSAEARQRETEIDSTITTASASSGTGIYEATIRYDKPPRYGFRLTGRAFDGEPGFGVGMSRIGEDTGRQVLSLDNRIPATDSLNLRYLFGWEDRLNLLLEQPLFGQLRLRSNLYSRKVYVNDEDLGTGYGADWEITHYERIADTDIYLSYRGAYSELDIQSNNLSLVDGLPYLPGFGPTPSVVEGLSADRIHREGVGVVVSRNFSDRWILSANAGVDYFFFLREFAWNAGGTVLYRPLKSIDVAGDVSYSSADNRGDEEADNILISLEVTNRF